MMVLLEWFGVLISWVAKWFKASGKINFRKIGFWAGGIISIYWGFFFLYQGQYGLVANAMVNLIIVARGIKNNTGVK